MARTKTATVLFARALRRWCTLEAEYADSGFKYGYGAVRAAMIMLLKTFTRYRDNDERTCEIWVELGGVTGRIIKTSTYPEKELVKKTFSTWEDLADWIADVFGGYVTTDDKS